VTSQKQKSAVMIVSFTVRADTSTAPAVKSNLKSIGNGNGQGQEQNKPPTAPAMAFLAEFRTQLVTSGDQDQVPVTLAVDMQGQPNPTSALVTKYPTKAPTAAPTSTPTTAPTEESNEIFAVAGISITQNGLYIIAAVVGLLVLVLVVTVSTKRKRAKGKRAGRRQRRRAASPVRRTVVQSSHTARV